MHSSGLRCLGHLAAYTGCDGAHVDNNQPLARSLQKTLRPRYDLFHLWRVGDHCDDDLRRDGDGAWRRCELRACLNDLLHLRLLRVARIDCDAMACLQQVQGHWTTHNADADKTKLHYLYPFVYLSGGCHSSLHGDEYCSAGNDRALLVVNMIDFPLVGSRDGMLHLHCAQNDEYLMRRDHFTVAYLHFDDRPSHGSGERLLYVLRVAPVCRRLYVGRLPPL